MAVNYQKLWNILSEKGMTRSELREEAGITTNAMVKLGRNESVQVEVLAKICRALNCTMDDILTVECDNVDPARLSNINIGDFVNSHQYETLGLTCIEDFPLPHTPKSLQATLIEFFICSKLSMDACMELVNELSDRGIQIDFPQDLEPDIKYIPQTFAQFDGESKSNKEMIYQQIDNFLTWAIQHAGISETEIFTRLDHQILRSSEYIVELGYIEACIHGSDANVIGTEMKSCTGDSVYPLNLLSAISGEGSIYAFVNRLSDLKNTVNELLGTLCPLEAFLIRIRFQYGIQGDQLLQVLGLPNYETLAEGIDNHRLLNKALRKMQHPSRFKILRDFVHTDPYGISYSSRAIYYCWIDEIKEKVRESMALEKTLEDALSPYYDNEVIKRVMLASNQWRGIPDVTIDVMDLNWKTYIALDQADIHTLDEFWFAHGKHLALSEVEESGLNSIAGIGALQIAELLKKMSEYALLPIGNERSAEIVDYAEKIVNDGCNEPPIACNCVPHNVLRCLLSLKYRRIADVIADYAEGNLEERIRGQAADNYEGIIKTLNMLESNQYQIIHCVTSEFWSTILDKNPNYTLQDIRTAYILDKPIKCNPNDLQINISSLFPTEPIAFRLMHRTRSRTIHWLPWPLSLFRKEVKKSFVSGSEDTTITKAFYAKDNNQNGGQWIAAEAKEDTETQYVFFQFDNRGLHPILSIEPQAKESIFQAIEFNAELLKRTPVWSENYSLPFTDAQLCFCKIYGSNTTIEDDQEFYRNYKPVIAVPQDSTTKSFKDITIEELDLSVRSYNCLKRANMLTVADIMQLTSAEFTHIRNLGFKSIDEIIHKLKDLGVPIRRDVMELYNDIRANRAEKTSE